MDLCETLMQADGAFIYLLRFLFPRINVVIRARGMNKMRLEVKFSCVRVSRLNFE